MVLYKPGLRERTVSADDLDQGGVGPFAGCGTERESWACAYNGKGGTNPVGEYDHKGESGWNLNEQCACRKRSNATTHHPLPSRARTSCPTEVDWNGSRNSCSISGLQLGIQLFSQISLEPDPGGSGKPTSKGIQELVHEYCGRDLA